MATESQGARSRLLDDFNAGRVRMLVATDSAARGLDIAHLPLAVNFDLPSTAEDYAHRIGRTVPVAPDNTGARWLLRQVEL